MRKLLTMSSRTNVRELAIEARTTQGTVRNQRPFEGSFTAFRMTRGRRQGTQEIGVSHQFLTEALQLCCQCCLFPQVSHVVIKLGPSIGSRRRSRINNTGQTSGRISAGSSESSLTG